MSTSKPSPARHVHRPRHRSITAPPPRIPIAAHAVGLLVTIALAVGLLAAGATSAAAAAVPQPAVPFATSPEAPSRYQPQVSCDPTEKPGTVALRDLLRATYGRADGGGIVRGCNQGGLSEHKEGRAYDWMLNAGNPTDKALADSFIAWLVGPDANGVTAGNAHRLGIQYLIWNRQTWQSWTGAWKPYTGASPHTDHVHFSLSWDGAFRRTSWWTGRAVSPTDHGPCQVYVGQPTAPHAGVNPAPCPRPVQAPGVWSGGSVLHGTQTLHPDQQLVSASGAYRAILQSDGNLVVYNGSRVLWHASTYVNRDARLVMQGDGNLVVYRPDNVPLWHPSTWNNQGSRLVMQDDGNLVVYRPDNRPVWHIGGDRG